MAFSDPITVTINAVAKVMPRVLNDGKHSVYMLADQTFTLDISHRSVVRDKKRRVIATTALTQKKIVPDPLTSVNDYETLTTSVQTNRPEAGFTATEVDQQWAGHKAWQDTTVMSKLFGGES